MQEFRLLRKEKPSEFRKLNVYNSNYLELYITREIDMLLNKYKNQNYYCTNVVVGIYYKVSAACIEADYDLIEAEDYYDLDSSYVVEVEDFEKENILLELEEEIIHDVETVEHEKDLYVGGVEIPESIVMVMGIEAYIYELNVVKE